MPCSHPSDTGRDPTPRYAGYRAGGWVAMPRTAHGDRTALVLPGTASSGRFVTAAFGPALAAAGFRLVTFDPPAGGDPLGNWRSTLTTVVDEWRPALVGGVSLGAHLATE